MSEMELIRTKEEKTKSKVQKATEEKPSAGSAAGPARLLKDLGRAIAEFDGETEQASPAHDDPNVIRLLMKNARVLMEAGESRLAFNILRNVLMRVPEHVEALRFMGISLREAGRLEEALKCFRALLKAQRSSGLDLVEAQCFVAETLYMAERDEVALAAYREILKSVVADQDKLFEIYKNVGNIHVRAGDFESAEEFYNKAYTLRPTSDALMVNYGTLEIQRENSEAAVARFRQAVEINPRNDKGWVGLAMVHRTMGDFELATANLECALDINRANRTAIRLLVEWSWLDQDFTTVIRRLQAYVANEGNEDAEICFSFAKILTQVGRFNDARLEMERVLALDPAIESGEALAKALDRELALRSVSTAEEV